MLTSPPACCTPLVVPMGEAGSQKGRGPSVPCVFRFASFRLSPSMDSIVWYLLVLAVGVATGALIAWYRRSRP